LKIVLDLQACQTGSRLGGIGRYAMALTKAMIQLPRDHEFFVVLNSLYPDTIPTIRRALINLLPPDRIKTIQYIGPVAEAGEENRVRYKVAELVREAYIRDLEPDAIFILSLFEGLYEEAVTSVGHLTDANRTATVLYDLIPLAEREKYLAQDFVYKWYCSKTAYLEQAALSLSISEFSREEGIDLLGLPAAKIVNMSSAIDSKFKPVDVSAQEAAALRKKLGIRNRFLMFTGSFDQRKNHEGLIRAFAALPAKLRRDYQLVMVGNGWDGAYNHLHAIGESVGLKREEMIFPGHVSDLELLQLYNQCTLFVFPSLREGFGLPVLEAMASGAVAIGSNVTSIPEVIGCEEALFDPTSVEAIRDKIVECVTDEALYSRIRDHGIKQAQNFSWERSAIVALDAIEDLVKRSKPDATAAKARSLASAIAEIEGIEAVSQNEWERFAQAIAANDAGLDAFSAINCGKNVSMRIGWVTTWNTRCGIATYTIPVSKAMPAEQWIFAPRQGHLVEEDADNVLRCWEIGGGDDLSELCDTIDSQRIDAVIVQFNYGFYDMPSLSRFLQVQAAAERTVFIILHSTKDPDPRILDRKLEEIVDGLKDAQIFVHQQGDIDALEKLGLAQNVHLMPLGMHEDQASAIMLKGLKKKRVIGTYGFALPNKGLIELIDSFALLAADQPDLHLLMVNAEFSVPESRALLAEMAHHANKLGIADRVTIVGDYLTNADSIGYLKLCDLIVIPYQNTTESSSGSARMALAAGKPVAVTPLHIFDDMRDAVFTLPGMSVDYMAQGIAHLLERIAQDDPDVARTVNVAELWVKAHGFSAVGRYLFSTLMEQNELQASPHFARPLEQDNQGNL
jgi:glycosyltransferase involved in cell wall biosynthesis